jgi:cytosine deaminase
MQSKGVEVVDLNLPECRQLMRDFIKAHPDIWNEDIGVDTASGSKIK